MRKEELLTSSENSKKGRGSTGLIKTKIKKKKFKLKVKDKVSTNFFKVEKTKLCPALVIKEKNLFELSNSLSPKSSNFSRSLN